MEPVKLSAIVYQGATFRLDLDRVMYPYPVSVGADGVVRKADGSPALDEDRVAEDYTGCEARMQIRETLASLTIIADLTDANGGISLSGRRASIYISDGDTAAMTGWTEAIGHLEIKRPSGDVERQYEIRFTLDPEVTR